MQLTTDKCHEQPIHDIIQLIELRINRLLPLINNTCKRRHSNTDMQHEYQQPKQNLNMIFQRQQNKKSTGDATLAGFPKNATSSRGILHFLQITAACEEQSALGNKAV